MKVTIYHNPRCSKSRNTLALLREYGTEPDIVEYLNGALTRDSLSALVGKLDVPLRDALRTGEAPYRDLGLADPNWSEAELVDFVVAHPILLNRPIVETQTAATVCRPEEKALGLLKASQSCQPGAQPPSGTPHAKT